ncbi:MAG TPA: NAD(P)H-hydrate dehydratase [Chloroflexi bacterium]|nr:NAD(P)H-hydrate dehydratase [Chloroflexota bacterium]
MPMKVVSNEEMAALEQKAVAAGITVDRMMEKAGYSTAQAILSLKPPPKAVLVLVGPGNNGGDGLVAAHYLAKAGVKVHVYLWKRKPEGDRVLQRVQDDGIPLVWNQEDGELRNLRSLLAKADIVVDALLGTGLSRPIKGMLKDILCALGEERAKRRTQVEKSTIVPIKPSPPPKLKPFIVAVDIPTGVNGSTGAADPATIPADITVTFGFPKRGHFLFPGAEYVGELLVADIGIPPEAAADISLELVSSEMVRQWLPLRPLGSHKGTFGKVLVVAGSTNYTGAAYLAGAATTRVGTGLVTMAIPLSLHRILASRLAEATYLLLPEDMGVITPDALQILAERWPSYNVLLLGPGLGQDEQTVEFVHQLVKRRRNKGKVGFVSGGEGSPLPPLPPLVIDADGLNALAKLPKWWEGLEGVNVLTPHPGEMGRLTGMKSEEVQKQRIELAREKAEEWGQVVLLKGAYSCIASPDGMVYVNPFANPALATAGSGDVLAGAIAGFMAQGLEPLRAAVVGAYVHGLAGEMVREEKGDAGPVAGDLVNLLPYAIKRLKTGG